MISLEQKIEMLNAKCPHSALENDLLRQLDVQNITKASPMLEIKYLEILEQD